MRQWALTARLACGLLLLPWTGAGAAQEKAAERWRASTQDPPTVSHDPNPSQPMAFAAGELGRYLGQILGVKLTEAAASDNRPTIRLSIDAQAGLTDEGYEIRSAPDVCRIVGGGDLGLVFGTYEFLRRYGGCCFSDLGPDGEYVPRKDRIEVPAGTLRMKPKLWYRGLQFFYYEDAELCRQRIDWMAKNGLNYMTYTPAPDESAAAATVDIDARTGQVCLPPAPGPHSYSQAWFDRELRPTVRLRGLKLDMNHHNLRYWLPPGRYFQEHPQWYALIDGKRGGDFTQLCVCTSNQEAVRTLTANVLTYLRENPEVKVVGIIQEDGYGMCQCSTCVAGDEDPKDAFRSGTAENRSKTRRYAKLLNTVAQSVAQVFPDVAVGGAAYVDMLWPPRDVELATNTAMWVALYWRDGCRPMAPQNTSELNQHFFDVLRQWKQVYRGRLIVYEYYMGMSAQSSLPYPMSQVICADWPQLKQVGVEGATVQCWTREHSVYALNNLAFARCGWYDDVNHSQLMDYYLLGAYGSVAEQVRPIFEGLIEAMRERAAADGNLLPDGENVRYFLDKVGQDKIQRALAAAGQQAAGDRERRQLERLAAAVRYWEMAAEFTSLSQRAAQAQRSNPKVALTLMDQALHELWPQLQRHLETSMPPTWMGVRVMLMWQQNIDRMRSSAEKLRKQASHQP